MNLQLVQNDTKSKVHLQLVDESGQTSIAEQELSADVKFSLKKDKLTITWMLDDKYKGKGETSITLDSHDEVITIQYFSNLLKYNLIAIFC